MTPEPAVVYLDESIYSHALAQGLRGAGVGVRCPGQHVPFGASDASWLRTCRENRWIVLMRDQRIRYRPSELAALRAARVAAVVLTGGEVTAQETADVTLAVLGNLLAAANKRRPFLYLLSAAGTLLPMRVHRSKRPGRHST